MSLGDVLGLGLGVVGFGVAIWQIVLARRQVTRAATAAEAARDAVARSERVAALVRLAAAIPRMQEIERELTTAVRGQDREVAEVQLYGWRKVAAGTRGLLHAQDYETEAVEAILEDSSIVASQAIAQLVRGEDLIPATKWAITRISAASEQLTVLVGRLQARPPVDGLELE
jgi:hypothetical protein